MNFSNSTTDNTESLKDTKTLAYQWESIDWLQVQKDVNRLQTRIAKATVMGNPNLQISKNHFLDEKYFIKRRMVLKSLNAARKGEEMLEPYERETLTYGS